MTSDRGSDPSAAAPTSPSVPEVREAIAGLLHGLRGRGRDPRGAVTIELDGTGRAVDVQIGSAAMAGNRGTLERSVREALDAAWDDLDRARRDHAAAVTTTAREQIGDLTAEARTFQQQASAQLDRVLRVIEAAAVEATSRLRGSVDGTGNPWGTGTRTTDRS